MLEKLGQTPTYLYKAKLVKIFTKVASQSEVLVASMRCSLVLFQTCRWGNEK